MSGRLRTDAAYMPLTVGLHILVNHCNTNYSVYDQQDHCDDDLYILDNSVVPNAGLLLSLVVVVELAVVVWLAGVLPLLALALDLGAGVDPVEVLQLLLARGFGMKSSPWPLARPLGVSSCPLFSLYFTSVTTTLAARI